MTRKPLVSVLMPYRKKDAFFVSALESMENQTYSRTEILTEEDRGGEGITILLNRLAKRAKGELLARMDADDISEPDRIEKQVKYLTAHPDTMLVGTWVTLIDESGKKIGTQKMPVSWKEIKEQVFFRNPLIHPSWMMRWDWFKRVGGYDLNYRFSQDWELVLRRVWDDRIENIPEPLIKLRIYKDSSSFANNRDQVWCGIKARFGAIGRKEVSFWKILYLLPKLFSLIIPAKFKYLYRFRYLPADRKGSLGFARDDTKTLGIVLPMGQSKKHLEESGQWSLWESELAEYKKAFDGVELFEYRYSDWRRFAEAKLLPLIQSKRFRRCSVLKAVHLTGAIPCLAAKLLYGIPYVLSYGYRYDEFAAVEGKWAVWLMSKLLASTAIRFADAAMVPTEELRSYVKNFGAKRIEVIPNGVDIGRFVSKQKTKNKKQEAINILFVGRLEKQKNLKSLVRAVSKLKILKKKIRDRVSKNLIPLKLVFIGSGSLKYELTELAQKLDVDFQVKAPMANEKLPEVYRQADIFVLPSFIEGHPKALIEAMSCGLPCLASNIPGVNEIIVDGENGLLVEPTVGGIVTGLEKLACNPELRRRMGSSARKTVVEKFDKKNLMRRECRLLRTVLAVRQGQSLKDKETPFNI